MHTPIKIGIIDKSPPIDYEFLKEQFLDKNITFSFIENIPEKEYEIKNCLILSDILIINTDNPKINEEILLSLDTLSLIITTECFASRLDKNLLEDFKIDLHCVTFPLREDKTINIIAYLDNWINTQRISNVPNKYYQDPTLIYNILKEKGVESLFHANTFSTSKTFIEEGAILSRSYIETNNLHQTQQKSDVIDKEFNIWDDVFIDAIDNHVKYSCANKYGPILFVLDLDLLLELDNHPLLVTRYNPLYWEYTPTWKKKYLANPQELRQNYLTHQNISHRMMFTIRSCGKHIKLSKYLKEIIIDRTDIYDKKEANFSNFVLKNMEASLKENNLSHIPIRIRHAGDNSINCRCLSEYNQMPRKKRIELFSIPSEIAAARDNV